jgi:hypothetical protein
MLSGGVLAIASRWILPVILSAAVTTVQAQLAELALKLVPEAEAARQAVLNHPSVAPFELEGTIDEAATAMAMVPEGPDLYARKRAALVPYEARLGPLMRVPSIRLHTNLGGIAAEQGLKDQRLQHAAYAVALLKCVTGENDGSSATQAFRVALVDDEYGYFRFMGIRVLPQQRTTATVDGRNYDVWTLRNAGDGRRIWFDVTANQDAGERVLKARMKDANETRK